MSDPIPTSNIPAIPNQARHRQTRIRIRIPKAFHQEPVISNLISRHQLTVNIQAALLGANARDDGWFDLELQGHTQNIDEALHYINDLGLEIWPELEPETW